MIEPRPYRDLSDFDMMQDLLAIGRRADNGSHYVHTGDIRWWYFYRIPGDDLFGSTYLWDGPDGLDGWAAFSSGWSAFDIYVQPGLRGSDKAEEMVRWAIEKAERCARQQNEASFEFIWVAEEDAWLRETLEKNGMLCSQEWMAVFEQSLEGLIPEPVLPEGFHVRGTAGEAEVETRARAQYLAFESSMPFERYVERFRSFMRSPVYNPKLDLVVEAPDGRAAAFCICWLDPVNRVGYFEPVGTAPDFQQKGLGKAVIREGLCRMKASGMLSAAVCSYGGNDPAINLYTSSGFLFVRRRLTYRKEIRKIADVE
ncbi:MAG: N-acetyltransferase [Chloroflexi bacterium]|nr:MAG: N-acetyltransferase [Chloroflexota bacterium]